METTSRYCKRVYKYFLLLLLCFAIAPLFITHCDARKSRGLIMISDQNQPRSKSIIMKALEQLSVITHVDSDQQSNTGPYGVSSPFTLPPFDSLAPIPLPENVPPYCIYPPFTPQPPSTIIPSPTGGYTPITPILPVLPPPSPIGTVPSPPESIPSPFPPETIPSPPESVPSPYISTPSPSGPILTPPYYEPSPPSFVPSPPSSSIPSPTIFVPSPPSYSVPSPTTFIPSPSVFLPPIVYPPPTSRAPPSRGPRIAFWCVAKPSVPDPIIQEAMNYACGSGADCDTIQSSGPCFEPNTVYAHASYAFNSYWQRTKVAGGTCSFGGTAMLVTVDPSHNGCHFIYA
ncbi:hypothetical protein Dsin_014896 [Dipteronia sinensis]|uniref:X8 domain-containing protein n=1 Tax=Dipteronia sinensis TaxID=43782 RepID=A0AAE0EAB8_9ROSI|nr:hypothetical protein Dsin_014896 [Dipteronia sinensis]